MSEKFSLKKSAKRRTFSLLAAKTLKKKWLPKEENH